MFETGLRVSLVCVRLEFRHYAFIVPKIAVDIV